MKWFIMEEIPRVHPLMTTLPIIGFTDMGEYGVEKSVDEAVVDEKHGTQLLIFQREKFSESGKWILRKVLEEPEWAEKLNETLEDRNAIFYEESEKLLHESVGGKTNGQLAEAYERIYGMQNGAHTAGIPWVVLEFDHQLFTNYLVAYLRERIKEKNSQMSAGEAFSNLTTPTKDSFSQKEEKSLLEIAALIRKNQEIKKLFASPTRTIETQLPEACPEINALLEKHHRDFCWIPYMYEGPAWKKSYFIEVLKGLVKENAEELLLRSGERQTKMGERQKILLDELGVDASHRKLFNVAKGLVFTKGYRKDCLYHFFYCLEPLLKEAAKRLGLTLRQVRRLAPTELVEALSNGKADADELNRRWKHYVYHVRKGKGEFMTGKNAEDFMETIEMEKQQEAGDLKELKGDCACPGFAKGVVKKVERPEDMDKMKQGDVLVAHATNPDIVPAMKKAGAIVTDLGGITCHAAIVSRELKIPCVIGTKVATSWVKDGDLVEVDATHGTVRKVQ